MKAVKNCGIVEFAEKIRRRTVVVPSNGTAGGNTPDTPTAVLTATVTLPTGSGGGGNANAIVTTYGNGQHLAEIFGASVYLEKVERLLLADGTVVSEKLSLRLVDFSSIPAHSYVSRMSEALTFPVPLRRLTSNATYRACVSWITGASDGSFVAADVRIVPSSDNSYTGTLSIKLANPTDNTVSGNGSTCNFTLEYAALQE